MKKTATTLAVLGMGKTGKATQAFLEKLGFETLPLDDKQEGFVGGATESIDGASLAGVVVSPGIPFDHPWVRHAQKAGIAILSDMDLFRCVLPEVVVVGVTGTNGKSTTTALVHHILSLAYPNVVLGGNIGVPVLEAVCGVSSEDNIPLFRRRLENGLQGGVFYREKRERVRLVPGDATPIYVLELSSYQLAWSRELGVDIAVWTNLTPDHLDRHGTIEAYRQAKQKIFEGASYAVMGVDDVPSRKVYRSLQKSSLPVVGAHVQRPNELKSGDCEVVVDSLGCLRAEKQSESFGISDGDFPVYSLAEISSLKGRHNWQNMALAVAAARVLGVPEEMVRQGLQTFKGLPHRLEDVGSTQVQTRRGPSEIRFLNDSKATNAESLIKALESFPNIPIYLLAGGRAKSDGIAPAVPYMTSVRKVFLFGEATDRFEGELNGHVPYVRCGDLKNALDKAWTAACRETENNEKGGLILLSPACASFDQFSSYEARGEAFRVAVRRLLQESL